MPQMQIEVMNIKNIILIFSDEGQYFSYYLQYFWNMIIQCHITI